jgi:uncharacterized membrane protein
MKTFFGLYFSAFVIMLLIDAVWLTLMGKFFYAKYIGHLMAPSPSFVAAAIFYVIYILGLTVFVLLPSLSGHYSFGKIFLYGAFFGFVAYATYDLTNQATLNNWSYIITIVDLAWGALLTGTISVLSILIIK